MAETSFRTVPAPVGQDLAVLRLSSCQAPNSEYVMAAVARHLTQQCGIPVEFCVVDVADDAVARRWAGELATVLDWPQEVHRFRGPGQVARARTEAC